MAIRGRAGAAYAFNAADGILLWQTPFAIGDIMYGSPIVGRDQRIYLGGFGSGRDAEGRTRGPPTPRECYALASGIRSRMVSSAGQLIRTGMLDTPSPRET